MNRMDPMTPPPPAPENPAQSRGLISPDRIYQKQGGANLMNPVHFGAGDRDGALWRSASIDAAAVILAGLFGYAFARYLAGGTIWFAFAALLGWCAASVIEGFLANQPGRRFLIALLETLAALASFYSYGWQALALGGLLLFGCLMWGYFSMRRSIGNSIEVAFFAASGRAVGKVVTGAVIFMIVMYAALTNNNGNFFVSQTGFNAFFGWTASFVNNFYPSVPLTGSFGDFADAVARVQLENNPQFHSLTPAQQSQALTQAAGAIVGSFTAPPDAPAVSSSTATSNVFYNYLAGWSARLGQRFSTGFVGAWGLLLFLILRSIGIIVVWAGQFVALLAYEILLASGFMKITEESATREVVKY